MTSEPDPGEGLDPSAALDPSASLDPRSRDRPRLDADGLILRAPSGEGAGSVSEETGPGLLWPVMVMSAGIALTAVAATSLVQSVPEPGQPRELSQLFLAAALALGGFSLIRLLQLWSLAAQRSALRQADPSGARRPVPWQLTDAHSSHAVWVIGVGSSVALMGALGLWSLAGDHRTGIEPGWPLLAIGVLVVAFARIAWSRTTASWERSGEGLTSAAPPPDALGEERLTP